MSDNIEARDYIARANGWAWGEFNHRLDTITGWHKVTGKIVRPSYYHPIPNTLDEAAKLPDDWTWAKWGDGVYVAQCRKNTQVQLEVVDTGDEKADRFALRLAVLKHMAAQETKR